MSQNDKDGDLTDDQTDILQSARNIQHKNRGIRANIMMAVIQMMDMESAQMLWRRQCLAQGMI